MHTYGLPQLWARTEVSLSFLRPLVPYENLALYIVAVFQNFCRICTY